MNSRYYLDTEFNSFGGSLISLGIVRHDDPEDHLYLVVPKTGHRADAGRGRH
jgi:hypothetical protein